MNTPGHRGHRRQESDVMSDATHVETKPRKRWWQSKPKENDKAKGKGRSMSDGDLKEKGKEVGEQVPKKMPVIFFDEAHKL